MNDEVRNPRDLRCSDVDRERVAEALREAAGDGRLTLAELEERLDATFRARTYGDLQPITYDLPQGAYPLPDVNRQARLNPYVAASPAPVNPAGGLQHRAERITCILGDEKRGGRWEAPPRVDVSCFLGDVTVDFSEAIVRHSEIVVNVAVVLGSVKLIVPNGIDVRLDPGMTILGERKHRLPGPVTPGGPVYSVRGFVVLGDLAIRPPKEKRSLLGGR